MKIISFLIPCYNSQEYMNKCIDSIVSVSDSEVEVIIVDDGSTDQTGKIADEYQSKYPNIIKVIHQANGGHGAGINAGIQTAEGVFFKVVDSDDWLDTDYLPQYLDVLRELENKDVQLLVNDYQYDYTGKESSEIIDYENVFPLNKITSWQELGKFTINQYLTIHSCTYRTSVLRECKMELPKHTFYEDNLYIYLPLPFVKHIYYEHHVLYHYFIGRPGQSMEEKNMMQRCDHQILVAKRIFAAYDVKKIQKDNPKLAQIMIHENLMMVAAANVFARLNRNSEAEQKVKAMWKELRRINPAMARMIRYRSYVFWVAIPGKMGRNVAVMNYHIAHKVLKFN